MLCMAGIRAFHISEQIIVEQAVAIGGVVITVNPDDRKELEIALSGFSALSVYGSDENGNIIGVIQGCDEKTITGLVADIDGFDSVLEVNLAYINDEK